MCDLIRTVSQPAGISVKLFQHQLASVYNIERLEREKCIIDGSEVVETYMGVHADDTGYGKTLSIIAVILRDKMEWEMRTPFAFEVITTEACDLVRRRKVTRYDKINATLIVVPPSIVSHWEKELGKTTLRTHTVTNVMMLDMLDLENVDVVLSSPRMYNKIATMTEKCAWKRFIFDEPGHIRIAGMKCIRAGFYWFVTATPNDITINHRNCKGGFMKALIGNGWDDFEHMFGGVIIKNDPSFIHASFSMPETVHVRHQCFNPVLNTVNGIVPPLIKTMIDAGNISGAISALGGGKTTNIVELVRNMKSKEIGRIESALKTSSGEKASKLEDDKQRVLYQLDDLERRFYDNMRIQCTICLDKLKSPVMEPNCQNIFCGECLLNWIIEKNTCPMCRCNIDASDLVYISSGCESVCEVESTKPTKIAKTIELINNKRDGRFLVFSAYDDTFNPIRRSLSENKIPYAQIKGTIKSREEGIESFINGESRVLFLNSCHNSAGVNLIEATDIILYHNMPPTTQTQIIGRANRLGRTEKLYVHHLVDVS